MVNNGNNGKIILIILFVIILILIFYSNKKDNEGFITSGLDNSVVDYNDISQEDKENIKKKLNEFIINIDNLIKNIETNNENGQINKDTINKITEKYDKLVAKINEKSSNEELYFDIEQTAQDNRIDNIKKELENVQFELEEELRKKDKNNYQIKSIKNPSNGLILNVHNTTSIQDGYKYDNLIEVEQNGSVEGISSYGKKLNMIECKETCLMDSECKGVSFNKTTKICQKRRNTPDDNPPDFSKNDQFQSWEKNDNFMILLNGKCLSYAQDILVIREDSSIKNWYQCDQKPIGVVIIQENLKNGSKILEDGGMGSRKYEIKGVYPKYIEYKYSVMSNTIDKKNNDKMVMNLLNDLYTDVNGNQKIIGIRLPHNKNARKLIVTKINEINKKVKLNGEPGFSMININSSYDLVSCNGVDNSQLFRVDNVNELDEYNNLVRDNISNGLKYNYGYSGVKEVKTDIKGDNNNIINDKCNKLCDNTPGCNSFATREVDDYLIDDCKDPGAYKGVNGDENWCKCKKGFGMNKVDSSNTELLKKFKTGYYGNWKNKYYKNMIGKQGFKCILNDENKPNYDTKKQQCVLNPEIHYNDKINTPEKCRDACKKNIKDKYDLDYENCYGSTFNVKNKTCKGSQNDNGYLSKNKNGVAWKKYSGNELRSLKDVPVPFSVIRPKNNVNMQVVNNKNECLTSADGKNITIEPCNLDVYQRWNPSHKIRSC